MHGNGEGEFRVVKVECARACASSNLRSGVVTSVMKTLHSSTVRRGKRHPPPPRASLCRAARSENNIAQNDRKESRRARMVICISYSMGLDFCL